MSIRELDHVNVDTTVQEKAVTFPTDAKLYHKMRSVLVAAAQRRGITLRQICQVIGLALLWLDNRFFNPRSNKNSDLV